MLAFKKKNSTGLHSKAVEVQALEIDENHTSRGERSFQYSSRQLILPNRKMTSPHSYYKKLVALYMDTQTTHSTLTYHPISHSNKRPKKRTNSFF